MCMRVVLLALIVANPACDDSRSSSHTPRAAPDDSPSAAFQRGYERAMREPTSPLTVVHSAYLEPGGSLTLAVDEDGALVVDGAQPLMVFAMDASLSCTWGCGASPRTITDAQTLPVPGSERYTVMASDQSGKGRILVHDAQVVATSDDDLLSWFPVDPALVLTARFARTTPRVAAPLTTNRGLVKTLYDAGRLHFSLADGDEHQLVVYGYAEQPRDGEPLLLPFLDATTGRESYGAGRYIELENPLDAEVIQLDFNRATNPYCAYSPYYNCPIPTRENRLPVAIRAGERYEHDK